ncbi:WD40 repeat domain-containing protein [Aspergillus candidus]|uniref:WD40 domain protein n=1 Tax=Aspergillus candidus TaxID=41067 RepID=A0A2I2EYG9_ASPCN|nr:WD40 domain protein [Aspergillus candidus]PLB33429.1 WD40 domain protein [Aspergillus candidus]
MDFTGGVSPSISLSDDGTYAAQINGKEIFVHLNPTSSQFKDVQTVKVKENTTKFLKFSRQEPVSSPGDNREPGRRLLHASDTRLLVWQLDPLDLHAEIESLEPGFMNIDFGGDSNEVIVFHAWNTKLTIFGLDTGHSQVIKSPKFAHYYGFGYRPRTRELAVLLKPDTTDILTIHGYRSYEVIGRSVLPTVDAQGLKWSPDGRWIAVWDAASCGTKVLIFTADGQLFRTYTGPPGVDDSFDLGVRGLEWGPVDGGRGASEYLAVAKVDGSVDLLSTKTFSCSTSLSHSFQIDQHPPTVWSERYANDGSLEYGDCSGPQAFSIITEPTGSPRGVSLIAFNSNGNLLTTVDQNRPNIVWIWELGQTTALVSILVHEHPVRQIVWHPSQTRLLTTTSNSAVAAVRHWCPSRQPSINPVHAAHSDSGRYDVRWLPPALDEDDAPAIWFGTQEEYVLGQIGDDGFTLLNAISNKGGANK